MRVLQLTPYISIPGDNRFQRKETPFGRCVFDIARNIKRRGGEVSLIMNRFTPGGIVDGVDIIGSNAKAAAKFANEDFTKEILQAILNSGMKKHRIFEVYLSLLSEGFIEKTIHRLAPEVIHIHGLTLTTFALLAAAVSSGFPTVFTVHELTGANSVASPFESHFEQSIIETLNELGFPISVNSEGVRSYILRQYHLLHPDNLWVIPPGIEPSAPESTVKTILRKMYGIPTERFVLVDTGPPQTWQHRWTLVEGYSKLDAEFRRNIHLLIPCDGLERARLSVQIRRHRLQENISLIKPVRPNLFSELYALGDLAVYHSDNPDFGLSILQSWGAGLPVLSAADHEFIHNLYHPQCMELVFEYSPDSFAEGIKRSILRPWNVEAIRHRAAAFSWDKVVQDYQQLYGHARPIVLKPDSLLTRIFLKMTSSKPSLEDAERTPLSR